MAGRNPACRSGRIHRARYRRELIEQSAAGHAQLQGMEYSTDAVGVSYSVVVGVKQGDLVDFVVNDGGTIDSDWTYFTAIASQIQ